MAAALRRRWRFLAIVAALGVVLLVLIGIGAISWVFSSKLLDPDHSLGPYGIAVDQVEVRDLPAGAGYRVTFERSETSARPGIFGLDYPDGHAIAHRVLARKDGEVTRLVTEVRGDLGEGTKVAFDEQVWEGNPLATRGVPYREIRFPSELGPMPAWQVNAPGDTWAIFVHGHNVTRQEGLRVLPSLRRAGLPPSSSPTGTTRERRGARTG